MSGFRTLSHEQARRFYDRLGARQDSQGFYEQPALDALCDAARFEQAHAVLELGCGTGRFAAELLAGPLPGDARYLALDVSETMVALARERLAPFGERVEVRHTDGGLRIDEKDASFDRVVSTYVLDLLSEEDIRCFLAEAQRLLVPGGLLCLTSLAPGRSVPARLVTAVWSGLHRLQPALLGGCRPLDLPGLLDAAVWELRQCRLVEPWALASEAVVAARR